MGWIAAGIKWIMLVSGVLTFTMVYAVVAPQAALHSAFGESLEGPLAEIVVRNWGALIALVGAMLVYGAFRPPVRGLVLCVAGISKLAYIGLVLAYGKQYLSGQVGISLAVDGVMVILFAWYLIALRRGPARAG
jgi:hypothetical protein